ncbi:MAG: sensor histidine kinase [Bacteroidota bacterium]
MFKSFLNNQFIKYVLVIVIISGVATVCIPLANTQNYHVVSFILLFVVSLLSTFLGIGPVLLASSLSALVWNFFFIPPHYTFMMEKTEDNLIFGLFFFIALVNGVLTTRVRKQEQIAREREKKTNALFQLTKELSKASGTDELLKESTNKIHDHFGVYPLFLLQDGNNKLINKIQLQDNKSLPDNVFTQADKAFQAHATEINDTTNQTSTYNFFPLKGNRLITGVLAVKDFVPKNKDQKSYWDTFISQISNALEREFLDKLAQKARFLDESDRLYKTLFNSISHELRIPVATIMGASDSIISTDNPKHVEKALCSEIFTASLRLNRLIENLLNISRLESGHISLRLDWYDINDLINQVTTDLKDELKPFDLKINISKDFPLVKFDFGLMEQVLYNLLINSIQYASPGTEINITVKSEDENFIIEICDEGPGFPEKELNNVFKKFFRVNSTNTGGLGLGLSIAKGFVVAHNGNIQVMNTKNKGAKFIIRLPSEKPELHKI